MRTRTPILVAAAICVSGCVTWTAVSLRDDDSILNVAIRELRGGTCWPTYSVGLCALDKMEKYQKKGRYDDAISVGLAWTEKHPEGIDSEWIYRDLSFLYLKKASLDQKRKEDYLEQSRLYRDRLLPSASDSPYALEPLETISEYVGDLSPAQSCVQYRNSMTLLDRMNTLLNKDKDRLAREFKPNLVERKEVQCLSDWIEAGARRVRSKQLAAGCP